MTMLYRNPCYITICAKKGLQCMSKYFSKLDFLWDRERFDWVLIYSLSTLADRVATVNSVLRHVIVGHYRMYRLTSETPFVAGSLTVARYGLLAGKTVIQCILIRLDVFLENGDAMDIIMTGCLLGKLWYNRYYYDWLLAGKTVIQ